MRRAMTFAASAALCLAVLAALSGSAAAAGPAERGRVCPGELVSTIPITGDDGHGGELRVSWIAADEQLCFIAEATLADDPDEILICTHPADGADCGGSDGPVSRPHFQDYDGTCMPFDVTITYPPGYRAEGSICVVFPQDGAAVGA